ncbi:phospholipase/carboxylesterase-like protein [Elsinoe australis]|uniref:Phospholipase/carboxylesterase-like protein n=1 Tax=Elsinoe australis TaxID=40998 RepID=A0A4V6DV38_9PEZI|nr:phospholipase/carboxylesterase-like protein [Elsinoe australis]
MASERKEKRLPTTGDFPSSLTLTITPAPSGQPPTNILVLLHGLGDSHVPFAQLGTQLNLPNTACIAIKGPNVLPFETTSFHWCDDLIFDSTTNGLDPDGGFKTSTRVLTEDIINHGLIEKCNYKPRDIVFLGLGQGGMAALNVAVSYPKELGGVVSIGGGLPGEASPSSDPKSKTPVICVSGTDSLWVTAGSEEKLKNNFQNVRISKYRRKGDTMPKDREEMMPIMQFFASRLRTPAPKGTVEVV